MEYKILENIQVQDNYYLLTLDISDDPKVPVPGQFYNIRCDKRTEPLLRRPFSLHRLIREKGAVHLQILYLVIGPGTEWLSLRQKGERLDAIGPFGNGFIIDEEAEDVVLVARGIGIAPLFALGEAISTENSKANITILIGARLKKRIFYERELKNIGEIFVYTDDGSEGFHGRAPDLLLHLLKTKTLPKSISLYACGPNGMLKELADISRNFGFRGQVAIESHMGCGFGVCLSCAFPLNPGSIRVNSHWKKPALQWSEDRDKVYSLICKDGPIYDILEVEWDEWLA